MATTRAEHFYWAELISLLRTTGAFLSYLTQPALLMSASAAIADPLLRRAFGQRARPSDPHRTARVRIESSRLRALVSRHGSAISRRTVMNNVGSHRRKGPQMFTKYAGMTMEERDPLVAEWANTIRIEEIPTAAAPKS
jgi:hypothetical protein